VSEAEVPCGVSKALKDVKMGGVLFNLAELNPEERT